MDLRDAFTVKLRADAVLDEINLTPELERHLALHAAQLAHYQHIEAQDFPPEKPLTRAQAIQHLILKRGMAYEQAQIDWGREALVLLGS